METDTLKTIDTATIITAFNAIAHQLIDMNAPLRFGIAETPHERLKVFQLRYQAVIEKGWMTPEQLPDGIEKDEYDAGDNMLYLAIWDGDELAATTRLIFPESGQKLPTEAAFELVCEPTGQVVDVGRTIIAKAYRDAQRHTLLQGVIGHVWLEATQRGYFEMCAIMTDGMINRYRAVGFEILPVSEAKTYWGEMRYPCRFDLMKTAETMLKRFGIVEA